MPNRRPLTEDELDAEMRALMDDQDQGGLYADDLPASTPDLTGIHAEDEPDLRGYDEEQRAEMAEIIQAGPSDGVIITDLYPDRGWKHDEEDNPDRLPLIVEPGGPPG